MSIEKNVNEEQARQYQRDYWRKHPEIRQRYRQQENANYLRRNGWTCIPPEGYDCGEKVPE